MTTATRILFASAALAALVACGGEGEARPEMSQRQRDSAIGASNLPGAQGVRGALEAGDTAAARRRLADSIASN